MDINDKSLHTRKLEILKSLSLPTDEPITHYVHRGQYRKYKEEVNNSDSNIETYVSVTLQSNDPRWIGVPIVLTTGKMLDRKANEIRIFYKNNSKEGGELIFGIQPSIGITIPAWAENSEFKISNYVKDNLPTAYEQVFIYAHKSDHNLFVSSEEVIESWRIITPIQESWAKSNDDLFIYEGGISSESIENK
jgi:glucose-6-phosphate 1-dehydrogenase